VARYANRKDLMQSRIVDTLRAAGVLVWVMHSPCDLLTYKAGRWLPLECKTATKTGKRRVRRDQKAQEEFIAQTLCPVVTTPQEALEAVGVTFTGDLP
jgi:hypothetical protein